jgi:competence protein ComEA
MLARRAAPGLVLAAVLAPSALHWRADPWPPRGCQPEGRGEPPRHWLGCAGDPGPPRDLAPDERLLLRLPIDPNTAGERELAFVPGLSRRIAREVVQERSRNGPFRDPGDLLRVKGIGPKRLERARAFLVVTPGP